MADIDFLIICGDFQECVFLRFVPPQLVINYLLAHPRRKRYEMHVRSSSDSTVAGDTFLDTQPKERRASGKNTGLQSLRWIRTNITANGLLKVPENFEKHAPIYDHNDKVEVDEQPGEFPDSQREAFCKMLGIKNQFSVDEDAIEGEDFVVFERTILWN